MAIKIVLGNQLEVDDQGRLMWEQVRVNFGQHWVDRAKLLLGKDGPVDPNTIHYQELKFVLMVFNYNGR